MKNHNTLKKRIILSLVVVVSLGFASVSMAKLVNTNLNTNNNDSSVDGTIIPSDGGNTINEEMGSVEKSIKKTEGVLNNLDKKTGNITESDSRNNNAIKRVENKAVNKDTSRVVNENNSYFYNKDSNVGESINAQVEALKALRERSFVNNNRIKSRILDDGVKAVSDEKIANDKENKNEVITKEKKINVNKHVDNSEKDISTTAKKDSQDLGNVENDFNNKIKNVESSVILKKKAKIIAREKTSKARVESAKDSDGDGISNYDEINIYGTNPYSADTNGNGYGDGAEILAGFDPNSKSNNSPIVYASPKNSGTVDENLFAVSKIVVKKEKIKNTKQINTVATSTSSISSHATTSVSNVVSTASSTTTTDVLSFKGKALPNSFVTLYIYSIPTVVTVKTDKDGNWNYTMDKEIENGNHEIYVAMTDSSGNIIAKSSPIPFVKEALAVTVNKNLLSSNINDTKPSFFNFGYVYMTVLVLIFLIGIVLTIIGVKLRFKKEEIEDIV